MAHLPWPQVISGASPVRLLALSLIALAAVIVQGARLKVLDSGGALSSWPFTAEVIEANRRMSLKLAIEYADALDIDESRTLTQIRDILRRLRVFAWQIGGESSDAPSNLPEGAFGRVLRDIQSKSDALRTLATQRESEGQVDAGGDVLPSQRNNICNTIDSFLVHEISIKAVKVLCKSLDHLRGLVLAHMDVEAKIFEISGRSRDQYPYEQISDGVFAVLEQERIWITHRLANESSEFKSPESRDTIFDALNQWMTKDEEEEEEGEGEEEKGFLNWYDVHWETSVDEHYIYDLAMGISVDEHLSLGVLITSMYRLSYFGSGLEFNIRECDDPDACARGEELSRMIQEKYDALKALVKQKERAGEVDEVAAMFPSQRNNICKNIAGYGLDPRMQREVVHLCEALDRWRTATLAEENIAPADYEASARLAMLKRKTGHADKKIVDEMDAVWTEERRWREAWLWREASETVLESHIESGGEAAAAA